MKEFFNSKERQVGVCAFFTMLVAMCMIGSYYLQYSQDLYWVKLFTNIVLLLCSGYVFTSSAMLNEKNEKYAALGLFIVIFFALVESVFGIIKRADWRMAAEAITMAVKAFGVITMLDVITFKKNLIKKWWYILTACILLLTPAVLKALSLNVLAERVTTEFFSAVNLILNGFVGLFGLGALVLAVVQIIKKNNTFIAWSSGCYSLSVFLYGALGILKKIGLDTESFFKMTTMIFEAGVILLLISIINYNKPVAKKISKKRK